MYLVVFYVGEYGWVCGCVGVRVCIQNRKVQNSLRSVGNCFAISSSAALELLLMNHKKHKKVTLLYRHLAF
jgi:hypothetical protein